MGRAIPTINLDEIDLRTGWPKNLDQVSVKVDGRRLFCSLNVAVDHHGKKIPERYLQASPFGPATCLN